MGETVTIGVRVPAELAARMDARGKRTEVVIAALERYLGDEPAAAPIPAPQTLHLTEHTVEMIREIVLDVLAEHDPGVVAPRNALDIPGVFRPELERCADMESGGKCERDH